MKLNQIIEDLALIPLTPQDKINNVDVESGYCSDLLSCVMAGAESGSVWITLMAHGNIVAVAALLDLAAIIITEGAQPENDTITLAEEKGITLLSTSKDNFHVVGKLWEMGLRAKQE
ncbi:MAG: DRTGG domain-containing protein [Chloroflexota bacterium]|nr:DRTGG domain-containing protein [Chloroflexota bacterium]